MFGTNEDNKHKSLLSKQELSAFNAKKKERERKLTEILRQILLALPGASKLELFTECGVREPRKCHRERPPGYLWRLYTMPHGWRPHRHVHRRGQLLLLAGHHQLDLRKLGAHLRPTVIARGGGQPGL